ncbi:hypothetical protein [Phascolarctobacterium sp.]
MIFDIKIIAFFKKYKNKKLKILINKNIKTGSLLFFAAVIRFFSVALVKIKIKPAGNLNYLDAQ